MIVLKGVLYLCPWYSSGVWGSYVGKMLMKLERNCASYMRNIPLKKLLTVWYTESHYSFQQNFIETYLSGNFMGLLTSRRKDNLQIFLLCKKKDSCMLL